MQSAVGCMLWPSSNLWGWKIKQILSAKTCSSLNDHLRLPPKVSQSQSPGEWSVHVQLYSKKSLVQKAVLVCIANFTLSWQLCRLRSCFTQAMTSVGQITWMWSITYYRLIIQTLSHSFNNYSTAKVISYIARCIHIVSPPQPNGF